MPKTSPRDTTTRESTGGHRSPDRPNTSVGVDNRNPPAPLPLPISTTRKLYAELTLPDPHAQGKSANHCGPGNYSHTCVQGISCASGFRPSVGLSVCNSPLRNPRICTSSPAVSVAERRIRLRLPGAFTIAAQSNVIPCKMEERVTVKREVAHGEPQRRMA